MYLRSCYIFFYSKLILITLFFLINFHLSNFWYSNIFCVNLLNYNLNYLLGIDTISLSLILLTIGLISLSLLIFWQLKYRSIFFFLCLFFCLIVLINVFLALDFFIFFFFFEAVIIPMFFIIGIWGSRSRKIYASYQFIIYTLLGSIFMLIAFLSVLFTKGTLFFEFIFTSYFFEYREFFFFFFLLLGFSVKIPVMPFHIWLPEAHVEAPTPGSVILAGILLKLGTYAVLRFLVGFSMYIYQDLLFILFTWFLIGFTYSAIIAFNQIDFKKIIAYSSISHMNFALLGLFSQNIYGIIGAFLMMLAHALTSSALFISVGLLYDRFKSRLLFYYGGLVLLMPILGICFFFSILANFAFPLTFNFVGELLILIGVFIKTKVYVIFLILGMILTVIYSLFLYNKIFCGPILNTFIRYYADCTRLEFYILGILLFFILYFGILPFKLVSLFYLNILRLF